MALSTIQIVAVTLPPHAKKRFFVNEDLRDIVDKQLNLCGFKKSVTSPNKRVYNHTKGRVIELALL